MESRQSGWLAEHKKLLVVLLAMSPVIVFLVIKLLAPFGLFQLQSMHLSPTEWDAVSVGLVEDSAKPVLLIKMNNEPPGFDIAYERVVALNPADGTMFGQVVVRGASWIIGVTPQELWLLVGTGRNSSVAGYSLPELSFLYDQAGLLDDSPALERIVDRIQVDGMKADLRISALDGHSYRLTPRLKAYEKLPLDSPPPAPTLLKAWKGCKFTYRGPLMDHRGCKPISVDGDALTLKSVKSGETGYFVIARESKNESHRWTVSDQQLFGDLEAGEPLRHIRYLTIIDGKIILVAEDGHGVDDIYAAAIDASEGRILWTRTFW
ncbi:MAG: hypothetical protein JRF33_17915 [Deltaproteobacteria bacterium]|nr:hypothetical protein [Deltaproteobacteria bacterium]